MAAKKKSALGGFAELIKTLVYALILAGLIRTVLFQPFWIPSGSMKPTLLIGDFLFVNKFAYGFSAYSCPSYRDWNMCGAFEDKEGRLLAREPQRGDVIVFRHPVNGQDYIKRLIGLPGDEVALQDGQIILNGQPIPRDSDGEFIETYEEQGPLRTLPQCKGGAIGLGADCPKDQYTETLPSGPAFKTLDIRNTIGDTREAVKVPDGHYFFMGDNRDNSLDSRFRAEAGGVGFVPFSHLIGRADRIMFSSAGNSIIYFWTWRSDRFFKAVE